MRRLGKRQHNDKQKDFPAVMTMTHCNHASRALKKDGYQIKSEIKNKGVVDKISLWSLML